MPPQPGSSAHGAPGPEGRRPPRRAAAAAAWVAVAAFAGGSLQGCAVKFLSSRRQRPSPLEVCPAFRFPGNGYVAEAHAGEVVNVTCPTDFTYYGPTIQCSWVDRFCVAYDQNKINPEFCYDQYNLTLAGQGLTSWPDDIEPKVVPPPTAGVGAPGALAPPAANASRAITGRRLSASLPEIVTPDRLSCRDEGWADLDFEKTVVDSAQQLDSKYAWSLRYRDITTVRGQKVDLLVTTVKVNISGKPERTGKGSAMGRININCSNTVPFKFTFVKALTGEAVNVKKIFFTLFDVVDVADPKNDKQVTVGSMQEYFVSKKTRVVVQKLDNGEYTFGRGPLRENLPGKPVNIEKASVKDMWLDSLNRSVVLMFRNISEFMIYVKVTPGPNGRDFEFTGWSEVAQYGTKAFCGPRQDLEAKFAAARGQPGRLGRARLAGLPAVAATAAALAALAGALALRRRAAGGPVEVASACRSLAAE